MSSSGLLVFTLLVMVFAAASGHDRIDCEENSHLLTENDGDIKRVHCDDNGLSHLLSENDGDLKGVHIDGNERTITRPNTSPPIFNPTPPAITLPTLRPTAGPIITVESVVTPRPVVTAGSSIIAAGQTPTKRPVTTDRPITIVLPTPAPTASIDFEPVCGKKSSCYQWFDEEWQLVLDGYTRCNARDVRRARRYCCVP